MVQNAHVPQDLELLTNFGSDVSVLWKDLRHHAFQLVGVPGSETPQANSLNPVQNFMVSWVHMNSFRMACQREIIVGDKVVEAVLYESGTWVITDQ